MNQKLKIGIAVATGFLLGFAVARISSKPSISESGEKMKKKDEKGSTEPTEKKVVKPIKELFPLKLGSTGEQVKRLQIFLMRQLGWIRQPNGEFDLITQERTRKYFKQDQVNRELYDKQMLDKMVHDQRKKRA